MHQKDDVSKELLDNWGKPASLRCEISFFYLTEADDPEELLLGGNAKKQVVQLRKWSPPTSRFKRTPATTLFQDMLIELDEKMIPTSALEELEGI